MIGICLNCKIEFLYFPTNQYGKYCSNKCQGEYRFLMDTIPRIESGKVNKSETLKKYLIHIRGNICEICHNNGTHCSKILILQIDHIDGNSDNNFPINLRLLCPNCHSQTETFTTRQKKDTKRNRYLRKFKSIPS